MRFALVGVTVLATMLLSGCNYARSVFKNNTGLEFGSDVMLCPGVGVRSQRSCKPTSDGWRKAEHISPATLIPGEQIFKRIENDYLLQKLTGNQKTIIHNFDLWESKLNNPKTELIVTQKSITSEQPESVLLADYIVEPFGQVNMSELYEKDALTKAVTTLEAEAKAKNVELNAEFLANVKSELQKKIKDSKNTTLTYHYIIAEYLGAMANREDDDQLKSIKYLGATVANFNAGKEIIVGISGILFSNFSSTQTVVEDKMLLTSIDASLKYAPATQLGLINDIKAEVSIKWSNQVNKSINTSLTSVKNGIFFYPLWVKAVSKRSSALQAFLPEK